MLMKTSVDFNEVAESHKTIDARLVNWARWSHNHQGSSASPMFRLYRSPETWAHGTTSSPVDGIDAQKVQKGVGQLPTKHRLALSWCYIRKNHPKKAATSIGETMEGLYRIICDARTMLINRKV